jgi:hypothetical protein
MKVYGIEWTRSSAFAHSEQAVKVDKIVGLEWHSKTSERIAPTFPICPLRLGELMEQSIISAHGGLLSAHGLTNNIQATTPKGFSTVHLSGKSLTDMALSSVARAERMLKKVPQTQLLTQLLHTATTLGCVEWGSCHTEWTCCLNCLSFQNY